MPPDERVSVAAAAVVAILALAAALPFASSSPTRRDDDQQWVAVFLGLVAVLVAVGSLGWSVTTMAGHWRMISETVPIEGRVIRLARDVRSTWVPVIRDEVGGRDYEFRASTSASPPGYSAGDAVVVRYTWPGRPGEGHLVSFDELWLPPLVFIGVGIIVGGLGALFLWSVVQPSGHDDGPPPARSGGAGDVELVVEPQLYRPRRFRGLAAMGCTSPFLVIGLVNLWGVGIRQGWPALYHLGIGVIGLLGGATLLRTRVRLDERGLTKTAWVPAGFAFRWEDVESWYVVPVGDRHPDGDSFTSDVARFRLRGRRLEVIVADSEVWRPGFDLFLRQVRQYAGDREHAAPGADAPSNE